jgi:hypothetical protein
MHELNAGDQSDYDFQLSSDTLARWFELYQDDHPEWLVRSSHGGHFKHAHLHYVAPELYEWASRWESSFGREVTIATFGASGPEGGLQETDWIVLGPRR